MASLRHSSASLRANPIMAPSTPPTFWPIEQLPGLSLAEQRSLQSCGIQTTADLLKLARTPTQIEDLARQLHRPPKFVQKWAALANLARVPDVGCTYCGLLLHAGISSPRQLAQASPHRLHPQILRLHVATLRRRDLTPTASQVSQWIHQAQRL